MVVVVYTLLSYWVGIVTVQPNEDASYKGPAGEVTGVDMDTLNYNMAPHYADGVNFGVVMSWFFPCFTGILSGANRADILIDAPRDLKRGTIGAITFSLFMYSSFMILWGAVAKYSYLRGDWEDYTGPSYRRSLVSSERLFPPAEPGFDPIASIADHLTSGFELVSKNIIFPLPESFSSENFRYLFAAPLFRTEAGQKIAASLSENPLLRQLAGGSSGAYVFEEIAWSPFPYSVHIGIIVSSMSQALQCLIVAPRLLQAIAKDHVVTILDPIEPLSHDHEPIRALGVTYVTCALLVLIGNLDVVAPLLTMCFLTCYINMNVSCFILTMLKAPSWRPEGIERKRWRMWYKMVGLFGAGLGITIMFIVQWMWALMAGVLAISLYCYIDYKAEVSEWGSGLDGIKFHIALSSLLSLEQTQRHRVNWRPQVLILYRVHLSDIVRKDPSRTRHHEILQFYSQLRKGRGMCVVAAVLEGDRSSERMLRKAQIEKDIIVSIMKQNDILGFAEVVVAPNWGEGANYILQLTGLGGLVPNTVITLFNHLDFKCQVIIELSICLNISGPDGLAVGVG